jgi:hypothetical protein
VGINWVSRQPQSDEDAIPFPRLTK